MAGIETIKNIVVETAERDAAGELRPLLLYLGAMTEGRARSLLNFTLAAMNANVTKFSDLFKISTDSVDLRHLCGLHSSVQSLSLKSWYSRLTSTRMVLDLYPGLRDYLFTTFSDSAAFRLQLTPIAETARRSHRDWRIEVPSPRQPRAKKPKPLGISPFYPYISPDAIGDHELLLAVDAAVPKYLPNSVRCDVCQDMIVAVLTGECSVDTLRSDATKYMRQFWKQFPMKYGAISLDAPVGFEQGSSTYGDMLMAVDQDWRN